ncbi:MAG: NAD(+) synthase [Eubacteriales bacterium]|nr:NAD(+) synthase [Eubacteriales bacterium]
MDLGYIKVAAATTEIRLADVMFNLENINNTIDEAYRKKIKILVFPELCLTGYTCGDLFLQKELIERAKEALYSLIKHTESKDMVVFVGLPWEKDGKLYNVTAAIKDGELLAIIPKTNIPNYQEFYEGRYFTPGSRKPEWIETGFEKYESKAKSFAKVPFGTDILLSCKNVDNLNIAAEICEDVWVPHAPSNRHAVAGATVIANPSASDEIAGKAGFRKALIEAQSSRLVAGYIYTSAGSGESTSDIVFGGHRMVAENGSILAESKLYTEGLCISDIDLTKISYERRNKNTFPKSVSIEYGAGTEADYLKLPFTFSEIDRSLLDRKINAHPFIPENTRDRQESFKEILNIQAHALKKRLEHINCKRAVIGVSGGLDSTLALLVTAYAFKLAEIPMQNILCITMPAFGTTDRTYNNALILANELGAELREINIKESVLKHFEDIGHDPEIKNAAYENSQARERTQILMDIANDIGGIVIGTGDLSELALGWCTYNGDHMSMYAVNSDIPKTLVRELVSFAAECCPNIRLREALEDVLDTPVSPELLPADSEGKIAQKTEDLVGPYELHDFFIYNMLRYGFSPKRILFMAESAFDGTYDRETIIKWLRVFYRRFFSQQFKRSCSVEGPKVLAVDLSPRGGLRMPSDAMANLWLKALDEIEENDK